MGLSFESKRIKLGLNITYYRRAKKITKIQKEKKIKISSTYLSQSERVAKTASLPTLMSIADALQIAEKCLFDFDETS